MPQAANAAHPDPWAAQQARDRAAQTAQRRQEGTQEALRFRDPEIEWLSDLDAARKRLQHCEAACLRTDRKVKAAHEAAQQAEADRTAIGDRRRALQKERGDLEAALAVDDKKRANKARLAEVVKALAAPDGEERQRLRDLHASLEERAHEAVIEYLSLRKARNAALLNVTQLEHELAQRTFAEAQHAFDSSTNALLEAKKQTQHGRDWRLGKTAEHADGKRVRRFALEEAQQQ